LTKPRSARGGGSIKERPGYPGTLRLRYPARNGRQVQKTFKGSPSAAAAEMRRLLEAEGTATVQDPGRRTVGDLLDEWLTHLEARGRSPRTLAENRREIETRIRPDLGPIRLDKITPKDLDDAYRKWGKELSASSVHRHGAVLAAALTQAVKWGWLAVSPALQATLPPQRPAQSLTIPDVDQIGQLIRGASDDTMKAAVALAFVTGARRGELCALRWSDIDLEAGVVRIARSVVEDPEAGLVEKGTKTGWSRFVTLDARAVTLLKGHQATQEVRAGGTLSASAFVLSDDPECAQPIRPNKLTDRFTKLRKEVGLPDVRFHDLRHANISQLIGAGIDVRTVSARAGHSSARMTLDRYAHALPAGDVAAAAAVGALLPEDI